jgi:hypothetical protein
VALRSLLLLSPMLLAACGSLSADPIGIGSGANDLKRSRCAGTTGSPCAEITSEPPSDDGLDRFRSDVVRRIG